MDHPILTRLFGCCILCTLHPPPHIQTDVSMCRNENTRVLTWDIYYLGHITLESQNGIYFTEKHDLLNDKSAEVSRIHPLGAMFLCTTSLGNPSKKLSRYFLTRKTKTSNRHSGSHLSSHYHLIAAQLCTDFCGDPSHIKWNNSVWGKTFVTIN